MESFSYGVRVRVNPNPNYYKRGACGEFVMGLGLGLTLTLTIISGEFQLCRWGDRWSEIVVTYATLCFLYRF